MTVTNSNDRRLKSWVDVPSGSDFPIQNLPFGIFRYGGHAPRTGVAIGESVVDVAHLHQAGYLSDPDLPEGIFLKPSLNDFLSMGREQIRKVRDRISVLLRRGDGTLTAQVRQEILIPQRDVEMLMPVKVPNYTDFYSSETHAFNVGSMFRGPENALPPNWKHMPIAYHGRASSIVVSGTDIRRPYGQIKPADQSAPVLSPSRKLDFELELAFITCGESRPGDPVPIVKTADYIAGFVLFNDWSARDIQQWEYVPLGPFLGKNFASTISPWVVMLDALEPFRVAGPVQEPGVLPYLRLAGENNFDIVLEVSLQPRGAAPVVLVRSNARHLYWNVYQQLAHHTVNGCNVQTGDLYASGTISGPSPGAFGSLLELAWNGQKPVAVGAGSVRRFLEDGDTVVFRGYAEKDGVRIGFGHCEGTIVPAHPFG